MRGTLTVESIAGTTATVKVHTSGNLWHNSGNHVLFKKKKKFKNFFFVLHLHIRLGGNRRLYRQFNGPDIGHADNPGHRDDRLLGAEYEIYVEGEGKWGGTGQRHNLSLWIQLGAQQLALSIVAGDPTFNFDDVIAFWMRGTVAVEQGHRDHRRHPGVHSGDIWHERRRQPERGREDNRPLRRPADIPAGPAYPMTLNAWWYATGGRCTSPATGPGSPEEDHRDGLTLCYAVVGEWNLDQQDGVPGKVRRNGDVRPRGYSDRPRGLRRTTPGIRGLCGSGFRRALPPACGQQWSRTYRR